MGSDDAAPDDGQADRERFARLFDAHYGELTRFAARRVGSDAASDIVSSTFLVAWRRRHEVPADNALPWLYATARLVVANELRSRTRRERLAARAGVPDEASTGDHAGTVSEQLRVRAVLAALPPADQEILRLTEWEGLTVAEAAIVLGCSHTAAKVRLYRARRRFAARLGPAEPGSEEPGSTEPGSTEPGPADPGSTEPGSATTGIDKAALRATISEGA